MKAQARIRLIAALSLLAGLPPLGAYQAAAQVAAVPAGRFAPMPTAGWIDVSDRLVNRLLLDPELAVRSSGLIGVLGQGRVELSLDPEAAQALAYVRHLPAILAADHAAFAALPLAEQARLAEDAAAAAAAEIHEQAAPLLARAAAPAPGDARRLRALKSGWFYLEPGVGSDLRRLGAAAGQRRALALARGLAARLGVGRSEPEIESAAVVAQEWRHLFRGARQALEAGPREGAVRGRLAPYAERALDAASERVKARGLKTASLLSAAFVDHNKTFGAIPDRAFVEEMRASGEWTDFVVVVLMRAARGLHAEDSAKGLGLLADMSGRLMFKLALPDWVLESARHATLRSWLVAQYPRPPRAVPIPGARVFSLAGIPVYLTRAFPAAVLGFTALFGLQVFPVLFPNLGLGAHLAQGLAVSFFFFSSVIAHELGHALASAVFGIRPFALMLRGLGAVALFRDESARPLHNALVALAGPAVNAALGVLFYAAFLALPALSPAAAIALIAALLNAAVVVENMLPLFPGDGGRVLRDAFAAFYGDYYRATRAMRAFSAVLIWGLAVLGGALALFGHPVTGAILVGYALFRGFSARGRLLHPGTRPQ